MIRRLLAGMATRIDTIAVVLGVAILVAVAFSFGPIVGYAALGVGLIALGIAGR